MSCRGPGIWRGDMERSGIILAQYEGLLGNRKRSRGLLQRLPQFSLLKQIGILCLVLSLVYAVVDVFSPFLGPRFELDSSLYNKFGVSGRSDAVRVSRRTNSQVIPLEVKQETFEEHLRGTDIKQVRKYVQFYSNVSLNDHIDSGILDTIELPTRDRIKIYVYDLPSIYNQAWLVDPRCSSHLFAAEVAIHQVLISSSFRTTNPEEADYFLLPVYVSCNFSTRNGFPDLSRAPRVLEGAVDIISQTMVYWNRSGGSDHIFVATHDFGACFHALEDRATDAGIPLFMQNSIILQTFGRVHPHPCQNANNIQIPPYVSITSVKKYWAPPAMQQRTIMVHFRGKLELHPKKTNGKVYSSGVRTRLWRKFSKDRRFFIKRKKSDDYYLEILRSVFCLCPLGWAPWSPRIVESVTFGCVPVIIADDISLPFSHAIDWPSISLMVPERDVEHLGDILDHVSSTNLTVIQNLLWNERNSRALLYNTTLTPGDATWNIFDLLSSHKEKYRQS